MIHHVDRIVIFDPNPSEIPPPPQKKSHRWSPEWGILFPKWGTTFFSCEKELSGCAPGKDELRGVDILKIRRDSRAQKKDIFISFLSICPSLSLCQSILSICIYCPSVCVLSIYISILAILLSSQSYVHMSASLSI